MKKEIKVEFNLHLTDIIITVLVALISICYVYYSIYKQTKQMAQESARTEIIQEHHQALRISAMKNKTEKELIKNDTRGKNN